MKSSSFQLRMAEIAMGGLFWTLREALFLHRLQKGTPDSHVLPNARQLLKNAEPTARKLIWC